MDALEHMANKMKANDRQLVVSLIMDEMTIQRNMAWCRTTNKFIGLVGCGASGPEEDFTLAKNALICNFSFFSIFVYILS